MRENSELVSVIHVPYDSKMTVSISVATVSVRAVSVVARGN